MSGAFLGFEAIAQRFPNSRITGKSARARCPVHQTENSHSTSLALREKPDGSVQITCFAGCEHRDIIAAVGLHYIDLLPDNMRRGYGQAPYQKPKFDGWPCLQTLDALLVEIHVCRICANKLADGQSLSKADHAALRQAHHRLTESAQRVSREVRHG